MTSRLAKLLAAASLILAAQAAYAMPVPSSTDEARALVGRTLPGPSLRAAATAARSPSSTDEARALAGRTLPGPSARAAATATRSPSSTDEARALAGT